jgi:Cytochrome P460
MKRIPQSALAAATAAFVIISTPIAAGGADDDASPIYGVKIPAGYRDWSVINVAHEAGGLDDLRVVLVNLMAMKAFRDGTLPFPDGAIIARLAWKSVPSAANNAVFGREQSFVTGAPTNLEFMVKDSNKYATSGGWGSPNSQTANPTTRRCIRRAFPVISPRKSMIFSSPATRNEGARLHGPVKALAAPRPIALHAA